MSEASTAQPLYRTRTDLERIASYGLPGVTPERLESMVQKKRIVIVDEKGQKRGAS